MLAAQAAGADLAYIGSPFIATEEANAPAAYKEAIVASGAADIVYSDLFTGVHGNYLRSSIVNSGLDPDNLAAGNLDTMKFGSDGSTKSKAWRDIWGSGQGIGAVDRVRPAAAYVDLIADQYAAAKARIFENQKADDFAVLNADDNSSAELGNSLRSKVFWFGGIERADSRAVDPHKWMYVPLECGCALVRDARAMRDAFSLVPPYLRDETRRLSRGFPSSASSKAADSGH